MFALKKIIFVLVGCGVFLVAGDLKKECNPNLDKTCKEDKLLIEKKNQKALKLYKLASTYMEQGRYTEAEKKYKEALRIIKELAKQDNTDNSNLGLSVTIYGLAISHTSQNRHIEAEKWFKESLKIFRKLAKNNPKKINPLLAQALNLLANSNGYQKKHTEAEKKYKESLKIYRKLAKKDPKQYNSMVAMVLNNLGHLFTEKSRYRIAEAKYEEALTIYKKLVRNDPDQYRSMVDSTLDNLDNLDKYIENEKMHQRSSNKSRRISDVKREIQLWKEYDINRRTWDLILAPNHYH